MRKNFTVILDGDDVLYRCNEEAVQLLNKKKNTNFSVHDIKHWGILNSELDERLAFFEEPEFVRRLQPLPGAKDFVKKLARKAEILVCTDVPSQCVGARINSIIRDFKEIRPENILIGKRKDMIKADMLIDDGVHNLQNTQVRYPVLFQQPWNYEQSSSLLSVSGYNEILSLIDTIKKQEENESFYDTVCLIGPPGAGKRTLSDLLEETGKYERVVTYSTKNDLRYNVISRKKFLSEREQFLETSMYMGDFYGTKAEDIQKIKNKNKIPVLVVDINGAMAIKHCYNALLIFLNPAKEECIRNILKRNLSLEETVQRLAALDSELKNGEFCDIVLSHPSINEIEGMCYYE